MLDFYYNKLCFIVRFFHIGLLLFISVFIGHFHVACPKDITTAIEGPSSESILRESFRFILQLHSPELELFKILNNTGAGTPLDNISICILK